jgi:diguanylate cyclase (GGDEF)-like protein
VVEPPGRRIVKPASALPTWWYLALGGACAVALLSASTPGVQMALQTVLAVQALPVIVVACRTRGIGGRTAAALLLVAGLAACSRVLAGLHPVWQHPVAAPLQVAAAAGAVAGMAALLRRRSGGALPHLAADTLIVALAVLAAVWSAYGHVVLDRWGLGALPMLLLAELPLVASAVFLAVVLLFDPRNRTVSTGLLVAGLAAATAAAFIGQLTEAAALPGGAYRLALALHAAAFVAVAGAVLHPSVVPSSRALPAARTAPVGRLVASAATVAAPVAVLAVTGTADTTDRIVRTLLLAALATVVGLRVRRAVQEDREVRAELLHGVQTDPLTGLPNRHVLLRRLGDLMRGTWNPDHHPTLFYVDLDRFKNINDSLGHAAGDEVLTTVASRLMRTVPASATVTRLSSDEYGVLVPDLATHQESLDLAERLLSVLREPLALSKGDVFVSASIGMAAIDANTISSPEDLVRHADTAMYRAKDAGRNCLAVYDESMHQRVAHRLAMETALYRAIDRRELRLYHQPIIDLGTSDVVGFEALMRWQRADGTIVSPAEFIPIAEDNGTIVPIGAWALLEALTQLRQWIDEGVCSPTATMSVNVSPRQLADRNFPSAVNEALARSGVPAQLLWLEVTESVMITEPELALATLKRLRSLGVRVALDDFGTGYSSLSLLQKFPLQRLKIDRAFVHGVADNPNDRSLVRTVVAMGRSLGLDLVAEGVESVHQLQVLSDLGCDKAQGYLISHPVPADAMRSTVAALERLGTFPGLHAETQQRGHGRRGDSGRSDSGRSDSGRSDFGRSPVVR